MTASDSLFNTTVCLMTEDMYMCRARDAFKYSSLPLYI